MASPILERDLQELTDLEAAAKRGDTGAVQAFFFFVSHIAKDVTKWQWVIHGETAEYRQRALRWLVGKGKYKQAKRFAMCGRGDQAFLGSKEGSVRIRPRGCGARFCPRCSRRYGRRFLSRVCSRLCSSAHGEIYHIVLTQRSLAEEGLGDAMARFNKAWKLFYGKLRALGMRSALATYHVKASSVSGWHYHCHLVVEFKPGVEMAGRMGAVDDAWFAAKREMETLRRPLFFRKVCDEGEAMEGLQGDRQMEFWSESKNPAETVLQYVLRDVLQGVEGWIGSITTDAEAEAFAAALSGAKLHRFYGEWRKPDAKDAPDEEGGKTAAVHDEAAMVAAGTEVLWCLVGGMDEVLHWAKLGRMDAVTVLNRLLFRSCNQGSVAKRLRTLVAAVSG